MFYSSFYLLAVGASAGASSIVSNGENLGAAAFFGILCFIFHSITAGYIILQWKQGVINFSASVESDERTDRLQIIQQNPDEENHQNSISHDSSHDNRNKDY